MVFSKDHNVVHRCDQVYWSRKLWAAVCRNGSWHSGSESIEEFIMSSEMYKTKQKNLPIPIPKQTKKSFM